MKDEKVPLRTILENFINHVEDLEARLKEKDDLYESEFQELKNISDALKTQKYYACTEGERPVNRRKNRYKDILPFDVSRVVLSEFPGVAGSDYINANYIRGASGSPAYIASQGPLPHTVVDFWRLTVECEVQVIVMACNQTESGKHKCEGYVPEEEGEQQQYGDVSVTLSQTRQVCPDFTVRKLTVCYTAASGNREERMVCQFHYSAWPDHGVPSSVVPLLCMIRMMRDTQASETLPVLVHCSAGCGRTGTVCAIDYVWGLLKAGKLTPAFNLFDLVAEMRRQRIAMVQTKDQYMLVHRAVRQLFADQLRMIESHPYANVDSAGKPLSDDRQPPDDDGDYEEICVADEPSPPSMKRPAPSPPPQIKPPPRKNAPRNRSRPPPLPLKRRAPQPGEAEQGAAAAAPGASGRVPSLAAPEPALGGSLDRHRPPSDPLSDQPHVYQGSLDRAEAGRRASVGRLRQVFETPAEAAPVARLGRSKSSALIRPRPTGGRARAGSVSDGRDAPLQLHRPAAVRPHKPPDYAEIEPRSAPGRTASSPPPARAGGLVKTSPPRPACVISRTVSPPQSARLGRASSPPSSARLATRASSPPPSARLATRTSSSPPSARPAARAASPPPARLATRTSSPPPSARLATRTSSPPPSARLGARTSSPPLSARLGARTSSPPPSARLGARAASPPQVRLATRTSSPPPPRWPPSGDRPTSSSRRSVAADRPAPATDRRPAGHERLPPATVRTRLVASADRRPQASDRPSAGPNGRAPPPDRRPLLPIKRSKSLKVAAPSLRVPRLGPAYLALENTPGCGLQLWAEPDRHSADRRPPATARVCVAPPPVSAGVGGRDPTPPAGLPSPIVATSRPSPLTGFVTSSQSVIHSVSSAPVTVANHRPASPVDTAAPAGRSAAVRPLYVNVSTPLSALSTPADSGSPPRYVNIDLLRQYEEELVQKSRELGLNDTLTDDQPSPRCGYQARSVDESEPRSWAAGPPLLSPALVTSATAVGDGGSTEPQYSNVPPPPPPTPPLVSARRGLAAVGRQRHSLPAGDNTAPTNNYPNCTPEARHNLRRIEADLIRNQRSGIYDTSGEAEAESATRVRCSTASDEGRGQAPLATPEEMPPIVPAAAAGRAPITGAPLGWRARERRNSFRQAVEGGEPARELRTGNYELIWVGEERHESATQCASLPPEAERRPGALLAPRPFGGARGRPAVVPVSSYIVQGDAGQADGCTSPRLVGNSLFWSDGAARTEPPAAARVTANSVFYSPTPSPPGRSTSLNVSENSAFKPYTPEKTTSPNYATVYRTDTGCDSPPATAGRADGARSADSVERGPVAPPRKRNSAGSMLSRLSVSQPQLVGPSHLFLADIELDCDGGRRDSDSDSLPPAVPEKTQAAYQLPGGSAREPPRRTTSPADVTDGVGGRLSRSLSLRPGARLAATEPRPFNRALDRLHATASNLRSRLSGRPDLAPAVAGRSDQRNRPGVNAHSRQAYI